MSDLICIHCNKQVSFGIAHSSIAQYGKILCIDGQIEEVKRTWAKQPVLMEQKLSELMKYKR